MGSDKGGGGGGRSGGRSQNGSHDDISSSFYDDPDKAISEYSRLIGVTKEAAKEMLEAVNQFTGEGYSQIRQIELEGKETALTRAINTFLSKAPTYKGEIYRGANFRTEKEASDFIKSLASGSKLGAMSSFSSDVKVGYRFAKGESRDSPGKYGVVIRVVNKSGVSVTRISDRMSEKEVLVPKNASYKMVSATVNPKYPGMTMVTLKER